MTHHPHLHMIVPGGGLSMDGGCWISYKPNFLLPVRVLSKLFCRLMAGETSGGTPGGQAAMARLTRRIWQMSRYSRRSSLHSTRSAGSSTPSVRSPARRPCSPICHGIPTASPSSPSPAEFRTPTSAPSNLHSPQQPSYPTSGAFLHWRLSDDGPGASRIVPMGTRRDSCTAANHRSIAGHSFVH
jgi:hypothetical protein